MASYISGANNANIDESPLLASLYNKLPHIDDMRDIAAKHAHAHAALLGLIYSHGLAEHLSIHLVHKHFDIPDSRVMVYETVEGRNHPGFVLSSPRIPSHCTGLRGLYFQARPDGKMAAYEYTTAPGVDLSTYAEFVAKFARMALDLDVENVFALTVAALGDGLLTEFEMADHSARILVKDKPTWLPQGEAQSTSTDWIATADYAPYADGVGGVPGIVQLKCLQVRSDGHYNVTCSSTRSGSHYQGDADFMLGGEPVPLDSEPYFIISQAMQMIEAR